MAFVVADRVKETTSTAGSGDLTLGAGDFGGFQTFSQGVGGGNSTYYTIENYSSWEVGIGTYNGGPNTLSRDAVLSSSNSGNKVDLNGLSIVFVSYPASKASILNEDGYITGITPSYKGVSFPDGTRQKTMPAPSGHLEDLPDGRVPLTLLRHTAGNVFQAYVDNAYDKTVGLHIGTSPPISPAWKLGLKTSLSSPTEEPSLGYAYGKDGSAGMYATTSTGFVIHDANGFWVRHNATDVFNAVSSTTSPTVSVKGTIGQSSSLQEWNNHLGSKLISVSKEGAVVFNQKISDTDAPTSSLYYSSTQDKLVFKDDSGSIKQLY